MWGVVGRGVWRMRGLWGDWSGEGHEVDRRREDVTNLWLTLGWEDPLEKGKVTHSSTLAWRIP